MTVDLGTYIGQKIRDAIDGVLQDNAAQITAWFKDAGGNVNVNLGGSVGSLTDVLTGGILAALITDPAIVPALGAITAAETAAGGIGTGFGIGYFLAQIGFQVAQPALLPATYAVNRLVTESRIDAATAAAMLASGVMNLSEADNEGHDLGFDASRMNQLYQQAITYPDVATLLEMKRRGLLPDFEVSLGLQRHGYTIDYQNALLGLERNLLSPADLALATLRGFMDPGVAAAYAAQLGVEQADFQTLLDNTGEPPGLEELLAMYRRNIIDQPTLDHGIRESRYRNEWIPFIHAFRFVPMSTADAIRARVENYLSDADAQLITAENGLDPRHYPYLVEAFGRPLSLTEMSSLYHRGLASEADIKQAVRESDIKDKYVDRAFELSRRLITERYIDLGVEFGAFTHEQALHDLMILGYQQPDAELILDLGQQQHHKLQKDLTASEVTSSYIDRLMSLADAKDALTRIGYKPAVAEALLDLAKFKHESGLAKIAQSETRALFVKADITKEEAIDRLGRGGTAHEDATALVDEWELAKGVPTRHLSESQIVKAAQYGIFTNEGAIARLEGIGYTESDATTLLMLAGLIKIPQRPHQGGPGGSSDGGGQGQGGGGGGPGGGPGGSSEGGGGRG